MQDWPNAVGKIFSFAAVLMMMCVEREGVLVNSRTFTVSVLIDACALGSGEMALVGS